VCGRKNELIDLLLGDVLVCTAAYLQPATQRVCEHLVGDFRHKSRTDEVRVYGVQEFPTYVTFKFRHLTLPYAIAVILRQSGRKSLEPFRRAVTG
jgi:hypothetical protein